MNAREMRLKKHRATFLGAMQARGFPQLSCITFLSDEEATVRGARLHELLDSIDAIQVQDWMSAKGSVIDAIDMCGDVVIFDNRWDVGAVVATPEVLRSNLDAFYDTVGPDFYCATLDFSHGIVFDKDEYACSLRVW